MSINIHAIKPNLLRALSILLFTFRQSEYASYIPKTGRLTSIQAFVHLQCNI